MSTPAPYFFISYSREDADLQQKIIAELRARGLSAWVDVENLIPGSPAWEREIEGSIRAAAGVIVLLSPDSNNSEWVRREISFAEQNEKRIFPVLVKGNEDASIPLRLSNHQRVDLRRNFESGLDGLANALRDHLGITLMGRRKPPAKPSFQVTPAQLRKLALPGVIALIALACIAGLTMFARFLSDYSADTPTPSSTWTASATEAGVTPVAVTPVNITSTAILIDTNLDEPMGKIVYTCQIAGDEVCLMNADGSGWRRLTNSSAASYYGSLSPDGQAILFISKESGHAEIYELNLVTGKTKQLTHLEREVGSPEISPDNKWIAFTYRGNNNLAQVWIMNRDGSNPLKFYSSSSQEAHDPAWSPDGTRILFAMGKGENNKLYIVGMDGHDPRVVNETIDTRGRSDWSVNNIIAFDMGGPFQHDIYVMNIEGNQLEKFSDGNNSQGANFSPDGKWMAFTAYTNVTTKDQASCEIYIIRVDGTDSRRLTSNAYCDYQPRWGN